jgi:hypothetical protein
MKKFLLRDFQDPRGYREYTPPLGNLARTPPGYESIGAWQNGESYVPWAITANGEVVYARTGEHAGFRGGGDAKTGPLLRPYDGTVSRKRRALCESELGAIALRWPHFTKGAVTKVSSGVAMFLKRRLFDSGGTFKKKLYDDLGHYFYTAGNKGFGRIDTCDKSTLGEDGVWHGVLQVLQTGELAQQLSVHDGVGRKLLAATDKEYGEYSAWSPLVREKWFDDKAQRGRVDSPAQAKKQVKPSNTPGIVESGHKGLGRIDQDRNRGVDMFQRDHGRTRTPNADAYYDDVDARNLLFGAGISGTTGTLLQAARAFGGITGGDTLKQYVMAIVGYLVGGGMHSYHETMAIAQRVGVPYQPGGYLKSLPSSFGCCPQFGDWRERYYDIVVLGPLHWRHNDGALPSHLNRSLKQP